MTGAAFARGKNDGVYRTPDDFRAAVVERFGYPVQDLACSGENQFGVLGLVERSLEADWLTMVKPSGLQWLNPPYGNIAPWARKCAESGVRVLLLVPASVGSNWFRDWVFGRARVYFLNGRLSFDGKHPYPKDLILCDYGDEPGFEIWNWRQS